MKKYSVTYIGQARYIDCIKFHKTNLGAPTDITAVLNTNIKEKVNFNALCKHSVNGNLTNKQITDTLKSLLDFKDIQLLEDNDLQIDLACQLFYTLVKSIETHYDYDFILFLTTDLIFVDRDFVMKEKVENLSISEPTVFCRIDKNDFYPRLFIINNLAIQNIRANWKTAFELFKNLEEEGKDRNEFATRKLFEFCGIRIQEVEYFYALRFRPNMDIKSIVGKRFDLLTDQEQEYRETRFKTKF